MHSLMNRFRATELIHPLIFYTRDKDVGTADGARYEAYTIGAASISTALA